MKKTFIFSIWVIVTFLINQAMGQSLPNPIRNYLLNNQGAIDAASGRNGTINGHVENFPNRFGVQNGAMRFGNNTHISTPGFFEGANVSRGFTISFWTFIDQNISKNTGNNPWNDTDPIFQAFYARSGTALINNTPLGFYRRRDRAIINRVAQDQNNITKDWGIWLWDPVNFTNRTGWYQITLVYERAKMTAYVFYPNGQSESMSHYFRLQDLSRVNEWGLGNINNGNFPFTILDDFKIYGQPLSRENVRELYARESVPNGMYKISIAANTSQFIHTQSRNMAPGARLELLAESGNNLTAPYQWVFEQVSGMANVFKIRMAYTENSFFHLVGRSTANGTRVETLADNGSNASFYQWLVEPAGDGLYTIRSVANRNLYLHPVGRSTSNSTALEVLLYNSMFPQFYRWRLNLLKTNFELQDASMNNTNHLIVPSFNTFLENQPQNTNLTNGDNIKIGRESATNPPFSNWRLIKSIDDSYIVRNNQLSTRNWHPVGGNVTNGTSVQALSLGQNNQNSFRWILDKNVINQFGRRYEIRPAINNNLSLQSNTSDPLRQNTNLQIRNKPSLNDAGNLSWQLFPFRNSTPVNKQITRIQPGIYRIRSEANQNLYLSTQNFSSGRGARLNIQNLSNDRSTSFYWEIDYEKDTQGNIIRDGSYLVKLFAADNGHINTVAHSLNNGASLEILDLKRNQIGSYKIFIEEQTPGVYHFRLAGNRNLYMHLWGNNTGPGTTVEMLSLGNHPPNTFLWRLERLTIDAPLESGVYRLQLAANTNPLRFLHTRGRSNNNGARLEILELNLPFASHYRWNIQKQTDNTYTISRNNIADSFVHPVGRSNNNGTRLEILSYNDEYSRLYKWIIERGTVPGSLRFRLVDFPSRHLHTSGNSTSNSAEVEILNFNQNFLQTYEWIPLP